MQTCQISAITCSYKQVFIQNLHREPITINMYGLYWVTGRFATELFLSTKFDRWTTVQVVTRIKYYVTILKDTFDVRNPGSKYNLFIQIIDNKFCYDNESGLD